MSYLDNEFFLLAVTFGVFFFSKLLQKKTGILLLNPILLTIAILIIFLKMAHISYETYNKGGYLIEFWLKPAVVALGVPLYLQLEAIKKQLVPILLSQLAGCIIGVVSVVVIAKLMGAPQRDNLFTGTQICHYSHCYGSGRYTRWNSCTDSCRGGLRRFAG